MSLYNPLSNKIVNGNIADADDVMNELQAIQQAFDATESSIGTSKTEAEEAAKTYTDATVGNITIDGGTY